MSPEDTPETPEPETPDTDAAQAEDAPKAEDAPQAEEAPKRRRRSRKKPAQTTEVAAELSADDTGDAVDETPEDVQAEEAAADVMLEADAEAEGEDDAEAEAEEEADEEALADLEPVEEEAEAPAPSRRRRRRGGAAAEAEAAEEEPAAPAAPTPAPSRRRRGSAERRDVVVRAQAKYVRSSARTARLVCDHIRGKSVEEARAILAHTSRAVARDWSKLLESAVANAENNHELVGEDLYVKAVHADEGPTIRRFRPRAMGRATRIRKRTSHLTILLTPKD
jgi:ribosomal protein L22